MLILSFSISLYLLTTNLAISDSHDREILSLSSQSVSSVIYNTNGYEEPQKPQFEFSINLRESNLFLTSSKYHLKWFLSAQDKLSALSSISPRGPPTKV